jgi:hypothetical protein
LLGLWDDQAAGGAVAADRRSRHGELMVAAQVPGDGVGPGVEPCSDSWFRSRMISSTVLALVAVGEVFGRGDRGSNAASPRPGNAPPAG